MDATYLRNWLFIWKCDEIIDNQLSMEHAFVTIVEFRIGRYMSVQLEHSPFLLYEYKVNKFPINVLSSERLT